MLKGPKTPENCRRYVTARSDVAQCSQDVSTSKRVEPLSVLSFNILAPPYNRIREARDPNEERRAQYESHYPEMFLQRQKKCLDLICESRADVICLQEFWFDREKKVKNLFSEHLGNDYAFVGEKRTGRKPDGLLTLAKRSRFHIGDVRTEAMGVNNRVALLTSLQPTFAGDRADKPEQPIVFVNTHLSYHHGTEWDEKHRVLEAQEVLKFIQEYLDSKYAECGSTPPVLLCGDFNGYEDEVDELFRAGKFSRVAPRGPVVSHLTHTGDLLTADQIWYREGNFLQGKSSVDIPENVKLKVDLNHVNSKLLPCNLPQNEWPREFTQVSDHRPVLCDFEVIRSRLQSDKEDARRATTILN